MKILNTQVGSLLDALASRTLCSKRLVLALLALTLSVAGPNAFAQSKNNKAKKSQSKNRVTAVSEDDAKNKTGSSDAEDDDPEDDGGLHSCRKARGRFKVNLKPDTELKDLVTWAFSFTCRNFIYDSKISSRSPKVTLMAPSEMSAKEAWRVFLVALNSMGLTVVPKGSVLEIIEHAQAKSAPLPIYSRSRPGASDQMVRVILRPEHLSVEDLASILQQLKSKSGEVTPIPKAGAVMITDFGSSASKMASIMLSIDEPGANEGLYLIRVQNADVADLATKLDEILGQSESQASSSRITSSRNRSNRRNSSVSSPTSSSGGGIASAVPSKIIADERTNALIILGGEAAYLRVKALVKRLDVAIGTEGEGLIHVYRLEHATADDLANTLTSVISGITTQQGGNTRNTARRNTRNTSSGGGSSGAAFEGQVRVSPDPSTNALVVIASVSDFRALKDVIKRLDVPRPQVYIEASIVEINIDNSRTLGAAFHGGALVENVASSSKEALALGAFRGGSEFSSLQPTSLASADGLVGGALGEILNTTNLLGTTIPSFGVFFQALSSNSNVNVLSTPHILTTDNEEAEISVGQNIPYQGGFAGGLSGLAGAAGATGAAAGLGSLIPNISVQRKDLALTLKLTPHISSENTVRMEMDLEIQDIASANFSNLGPSWSQKRVKDTVVVTDQQGVVLGGLISERTTIEETKIPLLGDIPLLGQLFRRKVKSKQKTNLLVILTPYIVHEQGDLERIVERRVREQREFMASNTNLAPHNYRPEINYSRKRGLVEEIHKTVTRVEADKAFLEAQEADGVRFEEGPILYLEDTKEKKIEPGSVDPMQSKEKVN